MKSKPAMIVVSGGPQTWPALPYAQTPLFGAPVLDWCVPLPASVTEVRLTASVLSSGPPNGLLSLWTTVGDPADFSGYSMADSAMIPLNAVGFADSGWVQLPVESARGDRFAAVVGSDGDGIIDTEFSQLIVWAR